MAVLAGLALWPAPGRAVGPHEVLLLVNKQSADSVAVARAYMALRGIPRENTVVLPLPESITRQPAAVSPGDFTRLIWEPAVRAAEARGIADHITAWVYATDFPVRVETDPPLSLQGITFLRNRPVAPRLVRDGRYRSPLYAGPDRKRGLAHLSQSFGVYREWLGDDMPLPSMLLGYIGPRGNARARVLQCLRDGRAADGTAPRGTVFFVTSDDIRSTCREWQYHGARKELEMRGVAAEITDRFPEGRDVLGILAGRPTVEPGSGLNRYLPGSMAEHLTSFSAVFDNPKQTKLTAWIEAGATASAGAVTEPRSIWTKFPNARFFVHYASGCTMIESFFQSIGSPLQILLVGEPLACPWAPEASLLIKGLPRIAETDTLQLQARVTHDHASQYTRFMWLVDGRRVGGDTDRLELETASLGPGTHRVRAVGYCTGYVRHQVWAEGEVTVTAP